MIYTFKDLRDQVLRNLDEKENEDTTFDLVGNLLNQANQYRCMQYPHRLLLWDIPAYFNTEVGRQIYPLHEEFMRPVYFKNLTAQKFMKEVTNRQTAVEGYNWNQDQGPVEHFSLWGRTQVKRQPTSASVLEIVSSDAADTWADASDDALNLFIRGETADGSVKSEIVSPNGLTPVQTDNSYVKIMQVTKAGPWTGTMTMTSNEGAVENLVLDYCDLGKMYQQLFTYEIPTTVEQIEYRFYRNPIRMSNDYDLPDIPYPFSQLLVWDTLVLMAGYNTEMNPQSVSTWRQMQAQMDTAFANAMQDGQSLGARNRRIRYGLRDNIQLTEL